MSGFEPLKILLLRCDIKKVTFSECLLTAVKELKISCMKNELIFGAHFLNYFF